NQADTLVYSTEKSLKDMGDKVSSQDKAAIEAELEATKKALEGDDIEQIKAATEKLTQVSYEIFGKIYQEQAQQQGANAGPQDGPAGDGKQDDNVVDADYEVVDDEE
ncbi:MAG: Hsp70 family protein, partial [Eubacteriales bacterium]